MKVKHIKDTKVEFKPYVKVIEISVETREDEYLLNKLKDSKDEIFLADENGSVINDNLTFTTRQEEIASKLLKDILSNL